MPAASMNWTELVKQIKTYSERPNDPALAAQIPFLIMLAENKLAAAFKTLGIQQVLASNLVAGNNTIAKPSFWRNSLSFRIQRPATEKRVPLLLRSYEFCREFAPVATHRAEPRYYSDYNYENFFIAPTPDESYPFELVYFPRLTPLSDAAQVNWFTINAPQLLLYACMVETQAWLKNFDKAAAWQALYTTALGELGSEDDARKADRDTVVR